MSVHSFSSILRLTLQIFDAITRRSSATSLGTCRYVVFRIVTGFTDSPIDFLQRSLQYYRTIGIVGLSNQKIEGPLNNDSVRLCVSVLSNLSAFVASQEIYRWTTNLLRSSPRNENFAGSSTDVLVNSFIEDPIEGFSALFTSRLSRLMSRLERRLFHRSVAHWQSPSFRARTPLNLTLTHPNP